MTQMKSYVFASPSVRGSDVWKGCGTLCPSVVAIIRTRESVGSGVPFLEQELKDLSAMYFLSVSRVSRMNIESQSVIIDKRATAGAAAAAAEAVAAGGRIAWGIRAESVPTVYTQQTQSQHTLTDECVFGERNVWSRRLIARRVPAQVHERPPADVRPFDEHESTLRQSCMQSPLRSRRRRSSCPVHTFLSYRRFLTSLILPHNRSPPCVQHHAHQ